MMRAASTTIANQFSGKLKRLIVNADDFGLTRGVNAGIIRAHRDGILTSTTIMANGGAFDDAVALARGNPTLGVGCHLVLVSGKALSRASEIPTLADSDGNLPQTLGKFLARLGTGAIRPAEMARELRAQAEKALAAGIRLTHFDSHKHTHVHPKVLEQVAKLAADLRIPCIRKPFEEVSSVMRIEFSEGAGGWKQRALALAAWKNAGMFQRAVHFHGLRAPDHFFGVTLTGRFNTRSVQAVIRSLPEGVSELMCHPGQYDAELEALPTRLKRSREVELAALTSPEIKAALTSEKVQLIHFGDLE